MAPPASTNALAYPTKQKKRNFKKTKTEPLKKKKKKRFFRHPFLPLIPLILVHFISDVQSWDKRHITTFFFFKVL